MSGMIRSFQQEDYDITNKKWLGTTSIVAISINPEIDDSYFEPFSMEALPFELPLNP